MLKLNQKQEFLFEENLGQIADQAGEVSKDILFTLRDKGVVLFFTKRGISYQWNYSENVALPKNISEATGLPVDGPKDSVLHHSYRMDMNWVGVNANVRVVAQQPSQDFNNYYLAHCPEGVLGVKMYNRLVYENLYPNIDAVYYFKEGHLKYDLILHEGADASRIGIVYTGGTPMAMTNGGIKLSHDLGMLEEGRPSATDGLNNRLEIRYKLEGNFIAFDFDKSDFNHKTDITIDPDLVWGTYYGNGSETCNSVTTDISNNVYMAGGTTSSINIATATGFQQTALSGVDGYIVKFDAAGNLGHVLWWCR